MSVQEVSGESRQIVKYVQLDDHYLIYLDGQDFLLYEFLEGCYYFVRFFFIAAITIHTQIANSTYNFNGIKRC